MSELDPDDYAERLKHLEQGHDILAAWILMLLVAILFISLGSFLGGAQHVVAPPRLHSLLPSLIRATGSIGAMGAAMAALPRSSVARRGEPPSVPWSAR